MTRIIIFATSILLSLFASAQVSETRNITGFSKIKTSESIAVIYTQSATTSVKVEADDAEKLKEIVTEVSGSTLGISLINTKDNGSRNHVRKNYRILKVYVSAPSVNDFHAGNSSSITFTNTVTGKSVTLDASTSASINGNVKADETTIGVSTSANLTANIETQQLHVDVGTSASAKLSGTSGKSIFKADTSASCDAKELVSKNASAEAETSASIRLAVTETLDADASTSGSIGYYGNPAKVKAGKSTSGSVSKKD